MLDNCARLPRPEGKTRFRGEAFAEVEERLGTGARAAGYRFAKRTGAGAANDQTARDAGVEVHISWRSARGDVADCGERDQRRWLAVRAVQKRRSRCCTREHGSEATHSAQVCFEGSAESDGVCGKLRSPEGSAETVREKIAAKRRGSRED